MAMLVIAAQPSAHAADDKPVQQRPPSTTDDDDTVINPAEPDYTLISLPTSLRLAQFKSAFRVTHRFARPLTTDVGGLAAICSVSTQALKSGSSIDSGSCRTARSAFIGRATRRSSSSVSTA